MNNRQTQAEAVVVIIALTDAKASVVCHPQYVAVILIDLDELNEPSNSTLALTLIDTLRAAHPHPDQLEALVQQITKAAQYICTRCDTPIPLGKDHSIPSGSMHDDCANEYQRERPEEF